MRALARATLIGAGIATVWVAFVSIFQVRAFPLPGYYVALMGATGGAVWHLLGAVPIHGRLWYYLRWILVSILAGLWIVVAAPDQPGTHIGREEALFILGMFIAAGVSLARYSERLRKKLKQ